MSLDVTVGGANAESYASVAELKAYAATRQPAISWVATATDPQIEDALRQSCRTIDACFQWTGAAVSATQALCWPRLGMLTRNGFPVLTTVNPKQLKDAQCELTLQEQSDDRVSDNDAKRLGLTRIGAGKVNLTFQKDIESTAVAADIAARKLTSELAYISDAIPGEVRRLLVPSWIVENTIMRGLLFRSFRGSTRCDG